MFYEYETYESVKNITHKKLTQENLDTLDYPIHHVSAAC